MYNTEIKRRLDEITKTLTRILTELEINGVRPTDRVRVKPVLERAYSLAFEEKLYRIDDVYSLVTYVLSENDRRELVTLALRVELKARSFRKN